MPASINKRQTVFWFWLPVLISMGVIFYTSSIPGSDIPGLFPFQDIVYHFTIYLIMSFLFSRALRNTTDITPAMVFFFTLLFGIIYGITDEWHQAFVPLRTVSGFDVLVDSIGSFMGCVIYRWLI